MASDTTLKIIINAIDKATAPIKRVGGSLNDLKDKAFTFTGKMAILGGGMGFLFKRQLLDVATAFEKYETTLTNVTGSSEKAKQAVSWLHGLSIKTPHGMPELIESFTKLKLAGIDAADGTLEALSDVAITVNKPLSNLADAFNDAQSGQFNKLKDIIHGDFKDVGSKLLYSFYDKEGNQKHLYAAKNDAKALNKLVKEVFEQKGFKGASSAFANTFDGLFGSIMGYFTSFKKMIMDSGVFDYLKEMLSGIVSKLKEMETSGELKELAKFFANELISAIKMTQDVALSLFKFLRDFKIPAIIEFIGLKGILIAITSIMAGPLLLSIFGIGKAIIGLGVAFGMTPLGWFVAGLAAVTIGILYLIRNTEYGQKVIGRFKTAFEVTLAVFNGAKAIFNGFVEVLSEIILACIKVQDFFKSFSLKNIMPDFIKDRFFKEDDLQTKFEMLKKSENALNVVNNDNKTKVETEVIIKGENLPPNMKISADKSNASKTRTDLGYSMIGAR